MLYGELNDNDKAQARYNYSAGHTKGAQRMGWAIIKEFARRYPGQDNELLFLQETIAFYEKYFIALGMRKKSKLNKLLKQRGQELPFY